MGFNRYAQWSSTPLWARPLALLAAPFFLAVIISLFAGSGRGVSLAQDNAIVRCNPIVANGIVGQPLAVEIYVENVQ